MSSSLKSQCRSLYRYYEPSEILAAIAIGLFAIMVVTHSFRTITTRTIDNSFMVLGGIFQLLGYIARLFSAQNTCNKAAWGGRSVLLLLGPSMLIFTITLTHTAFIRALNASRFCWVPLRIQRPLYLAINAICIMIQAIGGISFAAAKGRHMAEIGDRLIISAYVMQMVFWLYILAENSWVTFKLGKAAKRAALNPVDVATPAVKDKFARYKWWGQLFGLGISTICGRNMMRLTELGVRMLQENEWMSYAFDGYQMVVVMGAWAVFYPPGKCKEVEGSQDRYRDLELETTTSAERPMLGV